MSSITYTITLAKFKNVLCEIDRDSRVTILNEMKNKLLGDEAHNFIQELYMNAQWTSASDFESHYAWFSADNYKNSDKLHKMMKEVVDAW